MQTKTSNRRLSVVRKGNDLILSVKSVLMAEFESDSDRYKEEWFRHQLEEAGFGLVRPEEVGALTDADLWSETAVRNDQGDLLAVGRVYMDNQHAIRAPWTALFQDGVVVLTADPHQDGDEKEARRRIYEAVVSSFAKEWLRARKHAQAYGLTDDGNAEMVGHVNRWLAEPLHAVDVLAYTTHADARMGDGTFEDNTTMENRLFFLARWCLYEDVRAEATKLARTEGLIEPEAQWEYGAQEVAL